MNFFPFFNKGQILKQSMLENLRDNPRLFLKTLYVGYGDGILTGFKTEIFNETKKIRIGEGIVVLNGELYFHDSLSEIDIEDTTSEVVVYLNIKTIKMNEDGEQYQICFDGADGIELFRYKKTSIDANLKIIESSFDNAKEKLNCDFFNHGDRISLLNSKQSVFGGQTIRNEVLTLFAEKMISIVPYKPDDISFAFQCLNGINTKTVVDNYFGIDSSNCTKDDLISAMNQKIADAHNYYSIAQKETVVKQDELKSENNGIKLHCR